MSVFKELLKLDHMIQEMMGLEDGLRCEFNGKEKYISLSYVLNRNDLEIKIIQMEESDLLVKVDWNGDTCQEWYDSTLAIDNMSLSEMVLTMVLSTIIGKSGE